MLEYQAFKDIHTTVRSANTLARCHGMDSVDEFAGSLASGALVLDVGAGDATLGHTIARQRPDVSWTNFDYSYYDIEALDRLRANAPNNLTFVAGDATHLENTFQPNTFDLVLSYQMLPHLSLANAKLALGGMMRVAKPGGKLSVGPRFASLSTILTSGDTLQLTKPESGEDDFIDPQLEAVAQCVQLPPYLRRLWLPYYHAAVTVLDTNRCFIPTPHGRAIYDADNGRYVLCTSARGRVLRAAVMARAVRNFVLNRGN